MSISFGYDVFVSKPIPQQGVEPLPNGERAMWSPLSTTLIYADNDAVVVDPPFTRQQASAVGDWLEDSGKNITHIFATHGHGDHWFTAGLLADRFGAQIVATPGTIEQMHRNVTLRKAFWDNIFPGEIPETTVAAVPAQNNRIELEGHTLDVVEVGHTDTDATSVLHAPELDLVVAGDALYNGVHLYLAESADGGRDKWRSAVDIVAGLNPKWIVAGHKNKDLDDAAERMIAETRRYLDSADEMLSEHSTAVGFFNAMLQRHPDRLNPGALWISANGLYR